MPGKSYYFWKDSFRREALWFRPLIAVLFGIFFLRLAQLQLVRGAEYHRLAESNRLQRFSIPAPRGRIFDRNGEKLAGTRPSYSLYISPEGLESGQIREIADKIEELTGRKAEKILSRFYSPRRLPFGVAVLASHLTLDEILILEENFHYLPRVFIDVDPVRDYPYADVFSHITGYTGQISPEELERLRKFGYRHRDRIGKSGAEMVFDSLLRGRDGYREVEVGASGRHRREMRTVEPVPGDDILLSIDRDLQLAAAEAMEGKTGTVLAMDPSTGEILLWISSPGFDPGTFTVPRSSLEYLELFEDPRHPLFNRPIQGQYPPGSVFKLVTAAAALETGVPSSREYKCEGEITVGHDRRVFRCWRDSRHGKIDIKEALADSCNVYFYLLGLELGPGIINTAAREMGFGKRGQDIFPGEKTGILPDPGWKRAHIGGGWNPGDSVNMSVGQGFILSTPFQVLRMTSMIASGGIFMRPSMLKLVVNPDGKLSESHTPTIEGSSGISPGTLDVLRRGMEMSVESGTARFLYSPVSAGAKTGTAQNPLGDDHAWFATYAPADKPEIAIVVMVEHGGYGAVAALPVARRILMEKFGDRIHAKAD